MSTPVPSHGSVASFEIGTAATPNTLVDVSGYFSKSGIAITRDKGDATTFHMAVKKYTKGQKDGTIPLEAPYDATIDGQFYDLLDMAGEATFKYHPMGKGTGNPYFTGTGMVLKHEVKSDLSGTVTMTGEFQVSGSLSRGVTP
jgi:hypothetical protein